MTTSSLSLVDQLIGGVDRTLRRLQGVPTRPTAAEKMPARLDLSTTPQPMPAPQRELSGRLMRINHAGEVAAQALYHGQALAARDSHTADRMRVAADEEAEHLDWCEQRLTELKTHPSVLNPLWYAGSFAIGYAAGLAGDRWSLGFIGETERQVVHHLDRHLARLPRDDARSRKILATMQADEARHGESAMAAGGQELPGPVKRLMRLTASVMTGTAYWL